LRRRRAWFRRSHSASLLLALALPFGCGQLLGVSDHEGYPGPDAGAGTGGEDGSSPTGSSGAGGSAKEVATGSSAMGGSLGNGAVGSSGTGASSSAGASSGTDGGSVDGTGGETGGTVPSCAVGSEGANEACGANNDQDCCASLLVEGGTFNRPISGILTTVSDFHLDQFEVTVGRFRAFVEAVGDGYLPSPEAGKHAHLPASADARDPGWQSVWNAYLPSERDAWDSVDHLSCSGRNWTPAPGDSETLPIGCVNWFQAYAFCIWDGGFLPSVAELLYAAVGGSEEYPYPWGDGELTHVRAVYSPDDLSPVGSRTEGEGRWGHADQVGNVWEWAADLESLWDVFCSSDCLDMPTDPSRSFVVGGSFAQGASSAGSDQAEAMYLEDRAASVGFRCARSP